MLVGTMGKVDRTRSDPCARTLSLPVLGTILLYTVLAVWIKSGNVGEIAITGSARIVSFFARYEKRINCSHVMERMRDQKGGDVWPPPRTMPAELVAAYTQNWELPVENMYTLEKYMGTTAKVSMWDQALLDTYVAKSTDNHLTRGHHRVTARRAIVRDSLRRYPIHGQRVAVIGSESPWCEALLLEAGAAEVTTLEYGALNVTASRVRGFTPQDFARKWLKERDVFDSIFTYSSLEHSGLGRYGDALCPDGDINSVEEIYCMVKPGGLLHLGLPWGKRSKIVWNAHRIYGPGRMQHLGAGWVQLAWTGLEPWKMLAGYLGGLVVLQRPFGV
jgi:hypothetical protein